jgi:hypothetical protein
MDSLEARLVQVRTGDRDPGNRVFATYQLSSLAMLRGRLGESGRLRANAISQELARGEPPPALSLQLDSAWEDIWFREQSGSRD